MRIPPPKDKDTVVLPPVGGAPVKGDSVGAAPPADVAPPPPRVAVGPNPDFRLQLVESGRSRGQPPSLLASSLLAIPEVAEGVHEFLLREIFTLNEDPRISQMLTAFADSLPPSPSEPATPVPNKDKVS